MRTAEMGLDDMTIDPGLNFFGNRVWFDLRIEDLKAYVHTMDEMLIQRETMLRGLPEEDDSEPFPHLLHSSMIVAAVSLLEAEFKRFASTIQEAEHLRLGFGDIRGSLLKRFRLYVEQVASVDLRIEEDLWQDVSAIVDLRHYFAHGVEAQEGKEIPGAVVSLQQRRGVMKIEDARLIVGKETSLFAIEAIGRFLSQAYTVATDRYYLPDGA